MISIETLNKFELIALCKEIRKNSNVGILLNENFEIVKRCYELYYSDFLKKNLNNAIVIEISLDFYKNKCYKFVFADGSYEIPSLNACISANRMFVKNIMVCFREAISYQMRSYKSKYFKETGVNNKVKCMLSGLECRWNECDVDHVAPNTFVNLLNKFLQEKNLKLKQIQTIDFIDGGSALADKNLSIEWQKYHYDNAVLRVLKTEVHVKLNKAGGEI